MINRKNPPAFNDIEKIKVLSPSAVKLSNGSTMFVFNAGDEEIVRIQWVFENDDFDPSQPIINSALSALLLEGTSTYSSAQIAEKVDFYGAYLYPEYSYDQTTLNLITLTKYLKDLLPLVLEILNDSIFPQQEIDTYRRNSKQSLKISLKKNDYLARANFNNALFGESNYGHMQSEKDFDELKRDDLLLKFKKQFNPFNCNLFVSGKVDDPILSYITSEIEKRWYAPKPQVSSIPKVHHVVKSDEILIEKSEAVQSAIRIGKLSIQRSHPDFPALQVVNAILGGYFGSRLMMNIREDKGYTYGIGSGLASLKHAGFFAISSEVGVNVTANTLKEVKFEINRLKTEPVSADELSLVKNYLLGSMLGSLENIFSHTEKFKQTYFSGLNTSYYDYYTEQVKTITPERILELADKYFDFDQMTRIIVGKL